MPRYGHVDLEYASRLADWPGEDDGVYMLNLMAYRDEADYGPGGERGISGREADDRYAPVEVLRELGASVCLFAEVVDATERWDRVAVVRYPTRRSFIDMQARSDFQALHVHKEAGMERTIILGTRPTGRFPSAEAEAMLLEVWSGAGPDVAADGSEFEVEGTIVGDGRPWTRVRYSPANGSALPAADDGRQALLLRPLVNRWE